MNKEIIALKVNQWLEGWHSFEYDKKSKRKKPKENFYIFKLSAPQLKSLSGIFRRTSKEKEKGFIENIQRSHEEERSERIHKFIRYGYPYSDLSKTKMEAGQYEKLKKPGWLPTAIIINILSADDVRKKEFKVDESDLIKIEDSNNDFSKVILPKSFKDDLKWRPKQLHPIEVIDGQHRLWAFEGDKDADKFELPVVAFWGLDISWQAYLFWSINITPKKINASLAYDLYPLLRMEDWLEQQDNYIIYRETRAQELVEGLWALNKSPWHKRINMLGERGHDTVSQSAYLKSLISTFLRTKKRKLGGLFTAELSNRDYILPWNASQQVAYLIFIWQRLVIAINNTNSQWATALRKIEPDLKTKGEVDPAFSGKFNLLKTDQGVRGILSVFNDLTYFLAYTLDLETIFGNIDKSARATDEVSVNQALSTLNNNNKIKEFVDSISERLADFDWRTSAAPSITDREASIKAGYRGSGGYKMLRYHLLELLSNRKNLAGGAAKIIRDEIS